MSRVAIKRVGEALQFLEVEEKYRGKFARQTLSDADIVQYVSFGNNIFMGCDEDGLMCDLPFNFYIETNSPVYPLQKIVGDVVFVKVKPINPFIEEVYDYEIIPLTDEDCVYLNKVLDADYQQRLDEAFKGVGYSRQNIYVVKSSEE